MVLVRFHVELPLDDQPILSTGVGKIGRSGWTELNLGMTHLRKTKIKTGSNIPRETPHSQSAHPTRQTFPGFSGQLRC